MKRSSLYRAATAWCVCGLSLMTVADGQDQVSGPRIWKDASGRFQIEARLVEQTAIDVRLHTADGREITVPIERLSQADRDHLQSLQAPADNPFAGGSALSAPGSTAATKPPPGDTFRARPASTSAGDTLALPGTGRTLDLDAPAVAGPFKPDASSPHEAPPAGSVPITPVDPYDKVSPPVALDGQGATYLISIGRNKSGSPAETRGRIFAVGLDAKSSSLVWDQPRAVQVLDHDASTGQTLIVDGLDQFQRGGELVMVDGLASGAPKPMYRRTLPGAGKPGFAPQVQWARLLSATHAAVMVDGTLLVWDLPAAQLIYRIESVSASEPPVLSAHQIYLAVPRHGSVVILHTASGEIRAKVPVGGSLTPGVAFDPTGSALAACYSNQFVVWDIAEQTTLSEATTTEHLGSHPVQWIGPNMFLSASGDVVDVDLGMSVWKYTLSSSTTPIVRGSHLVTTTTSQQCTLASVAVPHAPASASLQALKRAGDAAMLVRPGSAVAIRVENLAGGNQSEIKAALETAATEAGWKVSDQAPIQLVAEIGRGEPQQLRFRSMRGGPGNESTATLAPFTAELQIRRGADVLWTRSTVNRVPTLLRLEEGETVQDAVKRYERPDASFFGRLKLPPRIAKPEIAKSVGRSVLREGQWNDLRRP